MLVAGCASAGSPHAAPADGPDGADGRTREDAMPADAPEGVDAPTGACSFSGIVATWSFSGDAGSQTSTAAASRAQGFTAGDVRRASSLTATAGADSINSSNWSTAGSRDTSKYYTLTITPPSGCALDLASAAIDAKSSSTGPSKAVIATSVDSYAATQTVSTSAASTPSLTVTGQTAAVEVRIYGWSASGTAGTMRLQNTLTLTGSLH
jgi:hypothetical protein